MWHGKHYLFKRPLFDYVEVVSVWCNLSWISGFCSVSAALTFNLMYFQVRFKIYPPFVHSRLNSTCASIAVILLLYCPAKTYRRIYHLCYNVPVWWVESFKINAIICLLLSCWQISWCSAPVGWNFHQRHQWYDAWLVSHLRFKRVSTVL